MKPGIYDQSNEQYHSSPGYSSTNLIDCMSYSEAHMKYWKENPQKPTPSMIEGTMLHEALIEPHIFESKYLVADGRSKEGKALLEANPDKIKVSESQMSKVIAMRDSVLKNTNIQSLITGAQVEKAFYWNDVDTGLLCKTKPDLLRTDLGLIIDIKTIDSGTLWNVKRAIRDYKYHLSAAFYKDGVNSILKEMKVKEFMFVFIEKEAPHGVRKIILSLSDLEKGFNEYKEALTRIKKCTDSGQWPSYPDEVVELNVFQEVS